MENNVSLYIIHNIFEQRQDVIESVKDISKVFKLLGREIDQKLDIDTETYKNEEDRPPLNEIPRDSLIFITESYNELPRRSMRENTSFLLFLLYQNGKTIDHLFRDCVYP